jgi:tetratricopeptide (TPR) repeat protein
MSMYLKRKGGIFAWCFWICAVFAPSALSGQSVFQRGEELFMQNKPQEAAVLLENALAQDPRNEKIYLYLGIAYEQLGNHEKAVAILQKGLEAAVLYREQFFFNMANNYAAGGDNEKAWEMYSKALEAKGTLSDAYLNRANVEIKLDRLDEALRDYRLYLAMEPYAAQRPQIEQMIRLIETVQADRLLEAERQRIAEEEKKRIDEERRRAEEERKRQEEEDRRVAEEKRRREEEARQKALLEEVLKSLQMSAEDASHLSAEKESIIEDRQDVDIDD